MYKRNLVLKLPKWYCFLILAVALTALDSYAAFAKNQKNDAKPQKEISIYPDEYSEFDAVPVPTNTKDELVLKTLEKARQKYLQALILVEKGDTTNAAHYFEDAIDVLNKLASYPNIDQNEDFTDLAQSIIEDYESYVQSIDNLDENSSFFIVREKLFQEIESSNNNNVTKIQSLDLTKDSTLAQSGQDQPKPKVIHDRHSIPLEDNNIVEKNIEFLSKNRKGRQYLKSWIERSTRWFPMMKAMAEEADMPEEIIYLSMIESGLNPTIVSKAQAVGLWQFIRSTGELYGLNKSSSLWVDERRDPEKATKAAMHHLSDLFNELGNWHLALAAYNCGINGVRRAIAKSGLENPDFWQISPYLPRETRNYVPSYIATAKIVMNPEAYGFNKSEFQYQPEYSYETYKVTEPVSLKAIAKCAGVPLEEVQALNPELLASFTPADATDYTVKLPVGTRQGFIANFATLSQEEKQPWVTHVVRRGESLRSIAHSYGVPENDVIAANSHLGLRGKLHRGTALRIPVEKREPGSEDNLASASDEQQTESNDNTTDSAPKALAAAPTTAGNNSAYITHVVKKGETLYNISQRYGVRLADIRNLNNLAYDQDNIEAGRKLKIAVNSKTLEQNRQDEGNTLVSYSPTPKIIKHTVSAGETIAQIADDYNVSVESIRDMNKIKKNILPGQVLKIKTEAPVRRRNNNTLAKETRTQLASDDEVTREKSYPARGQKKTTYKVRRGDNLGVIAARYGVSESDIKKWNPRSVKGHSIVAGTKLSIYEDQPAKGSSAAVSKKINKLPKYYKIRRGDNLGEIADKFGVSIQSLKSKNRGISERGLKPGQKLRIQ